MSCIQGNAYPLVVNLGRASNVNYSPSILCVTRVPVKHFTKTSLKLASGVSTYRQQRPLCLFGDKGKSQNTSEYIYIIDGEAITALLKDMLKAVFGGKTSFRVQRVLDEWGSFFENLSNKEEGEKYVLEDVILTTRTWYDSPDKYKWVFTSYMSRITRDYDDVNDDQTYQKNDSDDDYTYLKDDY